MSDGHRSSRLSAAKLARCARALVLVLIPSCLEVRDDRGVSRDETQCASCHGDPSRAGDELARSAPPIDLSGATDPSHPGVGAHAIHLTPSDTHGAVACDACHVVPEETGAPGHADDPRPAEIAFGALASKNEHDPSYDYGTRTCRDSYCHGEAGAVWTRPRAETCGTCHGLPPPPPHPSDERCASCHAAVIDAAGRFIEPALHVNGTVELTITRCSQCHGTGDDPAPPADTRGNRTVNAIGVGAHQAHLTGGNAGRPVACDECHDVPASVDDRAHVDGLPAEVALKGAAASNGREPTWQRERATCSDTWCHGPDASKTSPAWVDDSALSCSSCHGAPPAPPHPQSEQCVDCHSAVVDETGAIVARGLHVNGVVELEDRGCATCHGSDGVSAPPKDTLGNLATTAIGVGAHRVHLSGGEASRPVACTECHIVPESVDAPGHADELPAEVTFGSVASHDGRNPRWEREIASCADTWCHDPSAASFAAPGWTSDPPFACTTCHGMPPPPPHAQMTDCSLCHGSVVGADDRSITTSSRHVDGVVDADVPASCTVCHGSDNPAPPPDLSGNRSPTEAGVGAHQTHVLGTARSRAVPCVECHDVPATTLSDGHLDSALPAEVTFSGAALANGADPSYADGRCSGTPCHGAVFTRQHASGGTNTAPIWTRVDGTEASCGSCHGLPPPPPHPYGDLNPICNACHENIAPDNTTFVRPELHVDGVVTFELP